MYEINFKRYIGGLLPISMRGTFLDFCEVLYRPFKSIHHQLLEYRIEKEWCMNYNAQVCKLEAMLNSYFHDEISILAGGRRILIEDGAAVEGIWLYPEEEHLPVDLGCIDITDHATWGAVPFVVKVPTELSGNTDIYNTIDSLVRIYKLFGVKHSIIYY